MYGHSLLLVIMKLKIETEIRGKESGMDVFKNCHKKDDINCKIL